MSKDADPAPSLPITSAHSLLTSFSTFLTVAIHNILFYRAIYPSHTFLSARAYNLPVHQNRHPKVCDWVRDAVSAVSDQLAGGHVSRLGVVLHASVSGAGAGAVLERWMFDVSRLPAWPAGAEAMRDFATALRDGQDGDEPEEVVQADERPQQEVDDELNWADVHEQLRGTLLRMAQTAEKMTALPSGCTFTVALELKDEGEAPIRHPQAWIPTEPNLQAGSWTRPQGVRDVRGSRTLPLRSVQAGPMFFECWVEEGESKDGLPNSSHTTVSTKD